MVGLLQEGFPRTLNSKERVLQSTHPVRHSLWPPRFGKILGFLFPMEPHNTAPH